MSSSIEFIDLKSQYAQIRDQLNSRVQQVFDHGKYIMGPEVNELEEALQAYTGSMHCITVSSGTEALLISLMALGIREGDEVITTPFTFAATAEVIALVGATPVFVDIDPATCNINPSLIPAAITPKTKAIMPVSLYGQPADMDVINSIAAAHGNIPVIEDAAQSFGSTYRGKKSCNLSTIGCTSFFPSKPLGCYGDGGAIFTNNAALAKVMREIRIHGQERRYYHTRIGVGGRMDTLQCAIVLAKLSQFDWEISRRVEIGQVYRSLLADLPELRLLKVLNQASCVWGQFTVMSKQREYLCNQLNNNKIPTAIHYPMPLHQQPAFSSISRCVGSLEQAEIAANEVFSLPMHPYLDQKTQEAISMVIKTSLTRQEISAHALIEV